MSQKFQVTMHRIIEEMAKLVYNIVENVLINLNLEIIGFLYFYKNILDQFFTRTGMCQIDLL